ncbi:MAG: hypothetical protein AAGC73_05730 [Verrucomicrobiota bacterium]
MMNQAVVVDDKDRYAALAFTQMLSVLFVFLVAALAEGVYVNVDISLPFIASLGISSGIITFLASPTCKKVYPFLSPYFSVNNVVWADYFIDLFGLAYLISITGGVTESPFSPLLILLPTNGIIIGQKSRDITFYYIIVFFVSAPLIFLPSKVELVPNKQDTELLCYFLIHYGILATSLLGYWARAYQKGRIDLGEQIAT